MNSHDHPDRRAPVTEHWHLDKKVPLTLIFAMLMQGAMVIWAVADIKKDVELLKADAIALRRDDAKQSEETRQSRLIIEEKFNRLDSKLDRLIERRERP